MEFRVSFPGSQQTAICPFSEQNKSNSNKSTNQMQQSIQFITRRLFTAQHVSGVLTPIIRSSTTAVAPFGFTFGAW
jgi:hypothetical protein